MCVCVCGQIVSRKNQVKQEQTKSQPCRRPEERCKGAGYSMGLGKLFEMLSFQSRKWMNILHMVHFWAQQKKCTWSGFSRMLGHAGQISFKSLQVTAYNRQRCAFGQRQRNLSFHTGKATMISP